MDRLAQPQLLLLSYTPGRARRPPWPVRRRHVWQDTGLVLVKALPPLFSTPARHSSHYIPQNTPRGEALLVSSLTGRETEPGPELVVVGQGTQ
jgi:hypothetical protein